MVVKLAVAPERISSVPKKNTVVAEAVPKTS
jgi:hypothetical protein